MSSIIHKNIRHEYKNYIINTEKNIHSNNKLFWRFVNRVKKDSVLPDVMYFENDVMNGPQAIVDALSDLFAKHCTSHDLYASGSVLEQSIISLESNPFILSEDIVYRAARSLKPSFTSGLDGVPSFIVKDALLY